MRAYLGITKKVDVCLMYLNIVSSRDGKIVCFFQVGLRFLVCLLKETFFSNSRSNLVVVRSGFLLCTVSVCCFRCPWERNVFGPKLGPGHFFWKSLPIPLLCWVAESIYREKRSWELQGGNRASYAPRLERLWRTMMTAFTFFCFSLPMEKSYQDLWDCAIFFRTLWMLL